MAKNKVEITGINTSNIKTIKHNEMMDMFRKFQAGDKSVRELLIYGNMKLVLSLLKRYKNRSDNMDDLFQIGIVGLMKAIDNFDLSHEVRFSTYAVPMIDGEIKRYVRDNNSVRISRSIRETAYKIIKYRDEFVVQNEREPSTEEIASFLEITEFEVVSAINCLSEPASLYDPIYNDNGDIIYRMDQLEDKKENVSLDDMMNLRKSLNKLKKREKDILISRYVIGKTQMEIADSLGISQAQVSRLEKNAIDNIKRLAA